MARTRRRGRQRRQDSGRSLTHTLAAYATCAACGGLGAGILGYGGLRLFQEKLSFPELTPALLATAGALAGCVAGFRIVPRGWFPGERAPDAPSSPGQPAPPTRDRR